MLTCWHPFLIQAVGVSARWIAGQARFCERKQKRGSDSKACVHLDDSDRNRVQWILRAQMQTSDVMKWEEWSEGARDSLGGVPKSAASPFCARVV